MNRIPSTTMASVMAVLLVTSSALAGGANLTTRLVASGINSPVLVVSPPGDLERIFIVQQNGVIKVKPCDDSGESITTFLNINTKVINQSSDFDERGLLGLAFHPNYQSNGLFFVHYNNNSGTTTIERYQVTADPYVADDTSGTVLFTQGQPFSNHNGGMIAFSPIDGYLYLGLGDGGSGGDPGNRAQNPQNLLGKILRMDVDHVSGWGIPPSNPFVGDGSTLDEIWALGARNPWRFSFDRDMGDLWIADVGQNAWEELDFQDASSTGGENYGWRLKEGLACFNPSSGCDPGGLEDPIHVYNHAGGNCSITGGYVYRGTRLPQIAGTYFFGDWCSGRMWSLNYDGATVSNFTERTSELDPPGVATIDSLSSFGEDGRGELFVMDKIDGEVFKIVSSETPDVSISMVPQVPTIVAGQKIPVDVSAVNNTQIQQPVTGWLELYNPDGSSFSGNPIFPPRMKNIGAGASPTRTARILIPLGTPPGRYVLRVILGDFPNKIDSTDCFSFLVTN